MARPWARAEPDGVILSVHVQPGASRDEVVGEHGDALKIRLVARPTEGKANAALLAFLGSLLEVSPSRVELAGGAASRQKRVRLRGVTLAAVELALRPAADRPQAR